MHDRPSTSYITDFTSYEEPRIQYRFGKRNAARRLADSATLPAIQPKFFQQITSYNVQHDNIDQRSRFQQFFTAHSGGMCSHSSQCATHHEFHRKDASCKSSKKKRSWQREQLLILRLEVISTRGSQQEKLHWCRHCTMGLGVHQQWYKDMELMSCSIATRELRRYSPWGVSSHFPVAGQPWVVLHD